MTSKNRKMTSVSMSPSAAPRTEFNPDYSIVKRDLQRTGLLAGIFTVALIILSFIIP